MPQTNPLRTNPMLRMKRARKTVSASDWRMGFLAAVDRRLFPALPPAQPEAATQARESVSFGKGLEFGLNCPLATSLPETLPQDEYEDAHQYTVAACICASLVLIGIVVLYVTTAA